MQYISQVYTTPRYRSEVDKAAALTYCSGTQTSIVPAKCLVPRKLIAEIQLAPLRFQPLPRFHHKDQGPHGPPVITTDGQHPQPWFAVQQRQQRVSELTVHVLQAQLKPRQAGDCLRHLWHITEVASGQA